MGLKFKRSKFVYNTAVNGSTGVSPAFLNIGREPRPYNNFRNKIETHVDYTPKKEPNGQRE